MVTISIPEAIQILGDYADRDEYPPFTEDARKIRELLLTVQADERNRVVNILRCHYSHLFDNPITLDNLCRYIKIGYSYSD